jgi:hypothetical protein
VIDWLWQHLVLERIHHLTNERWTSSDVIWVLGIIGAVMVFTNSLQRKMGSKAAADEWKTLQETAKLAEREGWHGVRHWQARVGLGLTKAVHTTKPTTRSWSGLVFMASLAAFVGLIAWLTR